MGTDRPLHQTVPDSSAAPRAWLAVFKNVCGSQAVVATTCPSSTRGRLAKQDHPAYIPQDGYPPRRRLPRTTGTVQGMVRVRSGQAPAWPLSSDRSVRRGSGVKRDFACTFARHFFTCAHCPAATVTLGAGGAGTYTQRAIPGSVPGQDSCTFLVRNLVDQVAPVEPGVCGAPGPVCCWCSVPSAIARGSHGGEE